MSDNKSVCVACNGYIGYDAELCDQCQQIAHTRKATPVTADLMASNPLPPEQQAAAFFERPGDYYLINIAIPPHAEPDYQFAIKADNTQIGYATEILHQLRGALGQHARITITKATQLDPLPGTTEAYAIRPPQPAPEYVGKHRSPLTRAIDAAEGFPQPEIRLTAAGTMTEAEYLDALRKIQG